MNDITVQELKQRLDSGESIKIIDVRETHEYEEFNIGVENIPLGALPQHIEDLEDYKEVELVVHCRSGGRSAAAKDFLAQAGFKNVRNLLGGMLDWQLQFGS